LLKLTNARPRSASLFHHRLHEASALATAPANQLTTLHACILAAMGDMEGARASLVEPEARAARGEGPAVEIACAYHWLGDDDVAFEWLERGFEARELWMFFLHLEPRLRRLHGNPRFDALVRRVGMAPRATGAGPSLRSG